MSNFSFFVLLFPRNSWAHLFCKCRFVTMTSDALASSTSAETPLEETKSSQDLKSILRDLMGKKQRIEEEISMLTEVLESTPAGVSGPLVDRCVCGA